MRVLKVDAENLQEAGRTAVRAIRQGKVLACPTDTVYGLLADATNAGAVARTFQVKGREKGKPLPVFVKDIAMAKRLARVSREQEKFLQKAWPGKVTVVLESKRVLPKGLELDGKVALRVPRHELVATLLEKLDRPLTGTSANVSGQRSCSSAAQVAAQFRERKYRPDVVIEAGRLRKSRPSKIVDITGEKMRILRI